MWRSKKNVSTHALDPARRNSHSPFVGPIPQAKPIGAIPMGVEYDLESGKISTREVSSDMAADLIGYNNRDMDIVDWLDPILNQEIVVLQSMNPNLGFEVALVQNLEIKAISVRASDFCINAEASLLSEIFSLNPKVDLHDEAKTYSRWVLHNILSSSRSLGVSFEGCEDQTLSIFTELEKRMNGKEPGEESTRKVKKKQVEDGARELNWLQCSVNREG